MVRRGQTLLCRILGIQIGGYLVTRETDEALLERIVNLRHVEKLSFSDIATRLNDEQIRDITPMSMFTKDQVQKIYKRSTEAIEPVYETRTIGAVGDIHSALDPRLWEMLKARKLDIFEVGGDTSDSASASHYKRQMEQTIVAFATELTLGENFFKECSKLYPLTNVLYGNHDHRWHTALAALIPDVLLDKIDPIKNMIQGLPNVHMVNMAVKSHMPDGTVLDMDKRTRYMHIVGDALLSHCNFSGKYPGDAAKRLYDWTANWRRPLGWPELSLYIQFHGHKMSYAEREGGYAALVEPGMGGGPKAEAYKVDYDAKWGPASIGAVVFKQERREGKWKTLLSSVELLRPYR